MVERDQKSVFFSYFKSVYYRYIPLLSLTLYQLAVPASGLHLLLIWVYMVFWTIWISYDTLLLTVVLKRGHKLKPLSLLLGSSLTGLLILDTFALGFGQVLNCVPSAYGKLSIIVLGLMAPLTFVIISFSWMRLSIFFNLKSDFVHIYCGVVQILLIMMFSLVKSTNGLYLFEMALRVYDHWTIVFYVSSFAMLFTYFTSLRTSKFFRRLTGALSVLNSLIVGITMITVEETDVGALLMLSSFFMSIDVVLPQFLWAFNLYKFRLRTNQVS